MIINNGDDFDDSVVPSADGDPQRVYIQKGRTVRCYKVISCELVQKPGSDHADMVHKIVKSKKYLFKIKFDAYKQAYVFMEDLYNGELEI